MNKKEIKNILMSMRNSENEAQINYLLGEIDKKDDSAIQKIVDELDNNEENIRAFVQRKLEERHENQNNEKFPINDMFTYGLSGNCIHLHLPVDLQKSIFENGISKTMSLVNLHLLDAIDRIKKLKDDGFYKFQDKSSIYMISPALVRTEIKFLDGLDFITHSYSRKDLRNDNFIEENPEAKLAIKILGRDKNIGTASISFNTIDSLEWQNKKQQTIKDLEEKGISISTSDITKE